MSHDPAPPGRPSPGDGTPASQCTGYGDHAVDNNGQSVDVWYPGIRKACGYLGYENGDNPMPPGTKFPAPRPFRTIEHGEPVFGFKVFYLGADTATPCDDLRIIFHQGNGPGGRGVRFHSMQYAITHCDANGNYLGYTDVAAYGDTGGTLDVDPDPNVPYRDTGARPMKLVPTLHDIQRYNVFEVWYVDFFIYDPRRVNIDPAHPTDKGFPIVTVRPGFDIHNVATYSEPITDTTTTRYTCAVLGGGQPGQPGCQYDAAVRGLQHPSVDIYPKPHNPGYPDGYAPTDFCTDLYGGFDGACAIQQHIYQGSIFRTTCYADSGEPPSAPGGDPPNCYPEFVRGPNATTAYNKSSTPYLTYGPTTYAQPGLKFPD